jgi:hypothetical protein
MAGRFTSGQCARLNRGRHATGDIPSVPTDSKAHGYLRRRAIRRMIPGAIHCQQAYGSSVLATPESLCWMQ